MMIKKYSALLIALLLVAALAACDGNIRITIDAEADKEQTESTSDTPGEETPQNKEGASFPADASIPAPDFLSDEQKTVYRQGHELYTLLFGGDTSAVDASASGTRETVELDGVTYQIAAGKYKNWSDFSRDVNAVFTKDLWNQRNNTSDIPIYREHNGKLCFRDISMSQSPYFNPNFPDEFSLQQQSKDSISFYVTGHYALPYPLEGETGEQRDQRLKDDFEYTRDILTTMDRTENGWRLSEFTTSQAFDHEYAGRLLSEEQSYSLEDFIMEDKEILKSGDYQYYITKGVAVISKYIGTSKEVVIPAQVDGYQVIAIGNIFGDVGGAFQDCSTVVSVTIPEGVVQIQDYAFQSCKNLEVVNIPSTVNSIYPCAFDDSPKLKAVYFAGDAPEIARYAFSAADVIFYYKAGADGWTNPYYARPTKTY